METTPTATRLDVINEAVRRLRRRFGDRLYAIYALPESPYDAEDERRAIYLLAVLQEAYPPFEENEPVARLMDAVNAEFNYTYQVTTYLAHQNTELARRGQTEGVHL